MLIFADGFEHYGTTPNGGRDAMLSGAWASFTSANANDISISSTKFRTGSKSLKFVNPNGATDNSARVAFGGSPRITCGHGFGLHVDSLPASNQLLGFQLRDNTNTPLITFCIQSDGSIAARKGNQAGTIIDISDSILTAGTFNHIECKTVFDTVAGSVEVRVNGVVKMNIGALNLGAVGATQFTFNSFSVYAVNTYFDDFIIWDDGGSFCNDFLGPQRILTQFPTGDTAQADFAKNGAATGYGCISEVPPDADTTYISSATIADKSEFTLPTLPPELVTIAAVFVPVMARLDDAGVGNVKVSMVSGASVLAGTDNPLTTSYQYYKSSFDHDPDTSAAWTKSGLEAAKLRIEKSA